jgi:hypothetical protein|tara:strand:+ start:630 stop:809 length:180 start_codon:yes stop_codon:yes gene_type:complete
MSAPLANVRLPNPPSEYSEGYMARLINTLELLQQTNYFATSVGLESAKEDAEATAWFLG